MHGGPIGPYDWLKKFPGEPFAASDRLGWVGLKAARYHATPAFEFHPPALTHHMFILYARPPEQLELVYEGVKRHLPPPAGAIMLMPAGSPSRVRSSGAKTSCTSSWSQGWSGRWPPRRSASIRRG